MLCVAADSYYDESDYIRDYDEFLEAVKGKGSGLMQWTVRPYTPADEAEWDRFVMHESGNGTFLQTRNFLNYHPAGRFTDASLMVYNEHGGLGAVVPAALRLDGARGFSAPPGQHVWRAGAAQHLQLRG